MVARVDQPPQRALYFPYINVPDDEWFARVLLYWDAVGTIRPRGYVENRDRWRGTTHAPYAHGGSHRTLMERYQHTQTLIDLGLVIEVNPDDAPATTPGYVDRFLELLDAEDERLRRTASSYGIDVHIGKFGQGLFDELRRRGFARLSGHGVWCQMNPRVADLFMAYLASSLAVLPQYAMTPVTDTQRSLAAMSAGPELDLAAGVARQTLLDGILAAPQRIDDFRELVRFKERYGGQLVAFRRRVELEAHAIAVLPEEVREAHARLAVERLREERDAIAAQLEERRWTVASASLAVVGTAATVGLALHGGDLAAAGTSVLGAVAAARAVATGTNRADMPKPMAYAALAARRDPSGARRVRRPSLQS